MAFLVSLSNETLLIFFIIFTCQIFLDLVSFYTVLTFFLASIQLLHHLQHFW